jgi:hypothetical protein
MSLTKDQRVQFALLVREKKDILFGKYSPTVTKSAKNKAWEEICHQLRTVGATIKDVNHLRKVGKLISYF